MTSFETIYIDEMVAACNGGGGPLGHPRVYLNLAPLGHVDCPYCSRRFVSRAMAGSTAPTDTAPASGVATTSARGPGAARADESPPPRQSLPQPG
ncbi:MAG TPA: zinc-finger domain-containing protein [Stellaceae bacterium]|nr:zinc-finger domain-containing protein [Stellaceae bacterium]